jgi:peptide/nickel transport system substrate-binding protein
MPSDLQFHRNLSRRQAIGAGAGAALGASSLSLRPAASVPRPQATPMPDAGDGPTTPPGVPRQGGELVVGALVEPVSLHPWRADAAGLDVLDGIVDGLLRYNAAGRLQTALADDFAIAADDITYAFTLRPDISFHDGAALTAADVVASLRSQLAAELDGPGALAWDKVASIDAPDERTIVIRTTEPYAPFLSVVATAPIVPAALAGDDDRLAAEPIGTGPFRLERWRLGRSLALARFDEHWAGPAQVDRILVRFATDAAAVLDGLRAGTIHLSGGALGPSPADGQAAGRLPGVVVREHPTQNWLHLDLKQVGFLRERPVRQALDFATPRDRILTEVLGGRAVPAVADQIPGSWAFHADLQPRPFDPDRAAALLADAGLRAGRDGVLARAGEPFRLELWGVAGDAEAEAMLTPIAEAWSSLGIAIRLRLAEPEQLWGPLGYQFSDAMTACLFAWSNGNDPDNLFYWHSSQIPTSPTAPGGNVPAFFRPYAAQTQFDDLTARGASTIDLDARREAYRAIQDLLHEEVPVIFLAWEKAYPVALTEVGGFWPSPWTRLFWNARDWRLVDPVGATPDATPASATPDPAPASEATPTTT